MCINKMKQTKAIFVKFNASPVSDDVLINIPFQVKTIHVKSMNYDGQATLARVVLVESNLGLNSPFGIISQDDTYSQAGQQDIEIQVKNPITIQGYYSFTLKLMSGALAGTTSSGAGVDYIGMIVEFNGEDEMM
jgi:hypothetical protein